MCLVVVPGCRHNASSKPGHQRLKQASLPNGAALLAWGESGDRVAATIRTTDSVQRGTNHVWRQRQHESPCGSPLITPVGLPVKVWWCDEWHHNLFVAMGRWVGWDDCCVAWWHAWIRCHNATPTPNPNPNHQLIITTTIAAMCWQYKDTIQQPTKHNTMEQQQPGAQGILLAMPTQQNLAKTTSSEINGFLFSSERLLSLYILWIVYTGKKYSYKAIYWSFFALHIAVDTTFGWTSHQLTTPCGGQPSWKDSCCDLSFLCESMGTMRSHFGPVHIPFVFWQQPWLPSRGLGEVTTHWVTSGFEAWFMVMPGCLCESEIRNTFTPPDDECDAYYSVLQYGHT